MFWRFEAERTAIHPGLSLPLPPLNGIGEYRRDHPWRKPEPGMLLQDASDLRLDPARCTILGDKMSDMEAGTAAGIGLRVLIGPGNAKIGGLRYEVIADLSLHSFDLALRGLISVPGIPDAQRFNARTWRWHRPIEPPQRCLRLG
jgi:histidinol phosphatase-like enzyme